ncbi:MAG: NAD(P)-binding domain-containing protein [Planctomycetota bacterium]
MNPVILAIVLVVLVALLVALSYWQQKVDELEADRVLTGIRDAKQRGSDKALAQHPQIDAQACIGCGTCIAACPEEDVLGLVDGIAHIIHGSRCIGHGLCADACPVAAIQIGLGDVSGRTDLPELSQEFESTVPGVYIAGELGGFALIRIAIEQGVRVIERIAEDLAVENHPKDESIADVLIVGSGPAGFAASLKAKELGLDYETIDQQDVGGTIRKYPRRKLTIVGQVSLPLVGPIVKKDFLKEELIEFWESIIEKHELRLRSGVKFLGVREENGLFLADTSEGPVKARRVILALGRGGTPRKLGVPGENRENVLYQLIDAASFQNQDILVVGGGDSAIEAATGLANQTGNRVTLSYRKAGFFRLKARNEDRIREYEESGRLQVRYESNLLSVDEGSVELQVKEDEVESRIRIKNDYVFVFAGGIPPYPLLRDIGVRFNGDEAQASSESSALVEETL